MGRPPALAAPPTVAQAGADPDLHRRGERLMTAAVPAPEKPSRKRRRWQSVLTACLAVVLGIGLAGCSTAPRHTTQVNRPLSGYPGQNPELMKDPHTVWSAHLIGPKTYFAQPNDWTCNASSYIMIHRALTGRDAALDKVAAQMGAVLGRGAENPAVVEALRSLGPKYEVVTGQTSSHPKGREPSPRVRAAEKIREQETLQRLLREGYLVIINFREPVEGGGHYGVLQGINDHAIEIADPYYGLSSILAWEDFDFRTGYSDPVLHGWYAAVRRRS